MTRNAEVSQEIQDALERTQVGKKLTLNFKGLAVPIEVKYFFRGGWVVTQQLVPGMPLEVVRGEDGHLDRIDIKLMAPVQLS
ncbi:MULTISPECIES: hypothetical protein [unclassified Pseudomonas]|uniref:hypothetical protein n=1 Tax=unclassified Pseudomonas TaxID=196821 RepID=UPI0016158CAD|nr:MULTISPECIES: hypothetical protein [unclassified Pseudomonas]MBB6287622.1 hypothetical protein [Pseudomonas sp. SJZ073]MBB6310450.1 hypothetical protein [Pseudomonas sp. JAI120]